MTPAAEILTEKPHDERVSSSANGPTAVPPRSAIITLIRRHTRRAPPPPKWQFLGSSRWVRRLLGEPAELQSILAAQFPISQLGASGVLVRRAKAELALSPTLAAASKFFIQRDEHGVPVDIVSARGAISTDGPPWFPLASARRVNWFNPTQKIFLSCDDDDLHVLHRLGYRVMTSAGLEELSGNQLPLIFDRTAFAGNHFPFDFVLVGWRVADLSTRAPEELAGTLAQLNQIPRLYQLDPSQRFKVWLPSPVELRAVRAGVRLKDHCAIREELDDSLQTSMVTPAGALAWVQDQVALDYPAARRRLLRAVESSHTIPLIAETAAAVKQFRQAIQREFFDEFERHSNSVGGAWAKLGGCAVAELTELYFESHPLLIAAKRILAAEHPQYSPRLDGESLAARLRIVDSISKFIRTAGY